METVNNILFISHSVRAPGRFDNAVFDLLKSLDRTRFLPSALLLKPGPLQQAYESAGVAVRVVDAPDFFVDSGRDAFLSFQALARHMIQAPEARRYVRVLSDAIRDIDASVVVTTQTKAHLVGGPAGFRADRSVLWLANAWFDDPRLRLFMAMQARRRAHAVACCSRFIASQFRGHPALFHIYGGVDPGDAVTDARKSSVREQLGIPAHAPVVGMAADPEPGRGHDLFLRAAARIREDVGNAYFLMINSLADADRLNAVAREYNLAGRLALAGPELDEPALFDIMDVFVHPATRSVPFGRDIVQAMMHGKPVVASAAGGPEEIVRNAETGILVEPDDSVRLARAVVQLLDNPEVMQAFGDNGRARARNLFTLETAARDFETLLEHLCQ